MQGIVLSLAIMFSMLLSQGASAEVVAVAEKPLSCQKNTKQHHCQKSGKKKPVAKKQTTKPKVPPRSRHPEATHSQLPLKKESTLTSKQDAIREAFTNCIRNSTETDPTSMVVDFVFTERARREESGLRSFWLALRGSTEHHGHEICLVRAFGLKGFRTDSDVHDAHGTLLVQANSPILDIPESVVPKEQRFVRPWVRDYLVQLATSLRMQAVASGVPEASLQKLRVTDMVRTFGDQASLVRRGLSPADCRYDFLCSSHTSGSSVDFGFKDVTRDERARLQKQLIADQDARKIFFIIENNHYHVFVIPPEYMGEEE